MKTRQQEQRHIALAQHWPLSAAMPPVMALPAAAARARAFVTHTLARWDAGELTDDAVLITSELAANAVNASARRQVIRVCLLGDDTRILLQVLDQAPGIPRQHAVGDLEETGRGLALIAALASAWGWYPATGTSTGSSVKCVWAELARARSPLLPDTPGRHRLPPGRKPPPGRAAAAGNDHEP